MITPENIGLCVGETFFIRAGFDDHYETIKILYVSDRHIEFIGSYKGRYDTVTAEYKLIDALNLKYLEPNFPLYDFDLGEID